MLEPQETNYCCYEKKDNKRNCNCIGIILGLLFALLIGGIGLILGAVFAATLVANIAVLIASTVIVALIFILVLIYKMCVCKKDCYCK